MKGLYCALATLAVVAAVTAEGDMFGGSGSSWSSSGGGSSSSSSSSSSGGGGSVSNSDISQSQPGGRVEMQCSGPGSMVWYRQDGSGRRELARNGQLLSGYPRYRLNASAGYNALTINPAEESDTGIFTCESRAADGRTSTHTYRLTIGTGHGGGFGGAHGGAGRAASAAAGFMGALMVLI